LADCITIMSEFEFSVHTGPQSLARCAYRWHYVSEKRMAAAMVEKDGFPSIKAFAHPLCHTKRLTDTLPASLVMIRQRAWDVLLSIRFGT
jgi:uncharacterized membrane protein